MPYTNFSSNRRAISKEKRKTKTLFISGKKAERTALSISGSASVLVNSYTTSFGVKQSNLQLSSTDVGTGREAGIKLFADGVLFMNAELEDNADRFVMIKRVSPIMQNPAPIDSEGKPT